MPKLLTNPSRWLDTSYRDVLDVEDAHELLSESDISNRPVTRWTRPHSILSILSTTRLKFVTVLSIAFTFLLGYHILSSTGPERVHGSGKELFDDPANETPHWPWQTYTRLDGYFQGISQLVKAESWIPQNQNAVRGSLNDARRDSSAQPSPSLFEFKLSPYQPALREPVTLPDELPPPVQQCYLDADNTIPAPSIFAFDGVTQNSEAPIFGSHQVVGLRDDVCFDRYGRYGAYGLGYSTAEGGTGWGMHGDRSLTDPVWESTRKLNWSSVDLGDAQRRCVTRNRKRFYKTQQDYHQTHSGSLSDFPEIDWQEYLPQGEGTPAVPRTAVLLRIWEGMEYKPGIRLYLRSLVNELSLYSGGEYDVHLLIEVKDTSRPIWASEEEYNRALTDLVPEEFRSMATLWNQQLMQLIYPGPFQPQFHEHGSMYPAMRSMHFALQWFMIQHPEYEYFWNWEMDIRYIGHWYELFDTARVWAKRQPRRHAWTRSARYYISALYDDWKEFSHDTEKRAPGDPIDDPKFASNPSSGHERDTEEEADFITFNPIFNPQDTNWNRREDVTGYDTNLLIPERRSAIVAASRYSRRLLLAMHYENYHNRHSMASEMFPPTMALHHGLKAVYIPHPVYLERDWTAQNAYEIFNGGPYGDTGNFPDSVFGDGPKGNQMALMQSTYFYDAKFAEMLWWRWGGYELYQYDNEGGAKDELRKDKNGVAKGRMCLRSMLFHPVKYDEGRSY